MRQDDIQLSFMEREKKRDIEKEREREASPGGVMNLVPELTCQQVIEIHLSSIPADPLSCLLG